MPLLVILVAPLLALGLVLLMPLTLVQRYRVGTARRLARGWVATINVAGLAFSSTLFLATAALTSIWVPKALTYTLAGFAAGGVLGVLGLALSRWESGPHALHYTPNRWLVLGVTLVVAARLAYGLWRGWQTWQPGVDETWWLLASGAAGSLGAGAIVLGYYFVYWMGVRRRIGRHRRGSR